MPTLQRPGREARMMAQWGGHGIALNCQNPSASTHWRGAAQAASGCPSRNSKSLPNAPGRRTTSGFKRRTNSPLATPSPRLTAEAKPRFLSLTMILA